MHVNDDIYRDRNLGGRVGRPWWSSAGWSVMRWGGAFAGAAVDEVVDGGDAALQAYGDRVRGGAGDAVEDGAGGVEVTGAGVALGKPGLVEGDFAGMGGVVAGEGAGEQRFGVRWCAEFDEAAGCHHVDLGAVEPVHPFRFDDGGGALVVGVVDGVQRPAGASGSWVRAAAQARRSVSSARTTGVA